MTTQSTSTLLAAARAFLIPGEREKQIRAVRREQIDGVRRLTRKHYVTKWPAPVEWSAKRLT